MDDRWVCEDHEDGELVHAVLSEGLVRFHRDFWQHDCIDIDVNAGVATHRSQGRHESDDPNDWHCVRNSIRRSGEGWEIRIEQTVLDRWIAARESTVRGRQAFAAKFPGAMLTGKVGVAKRRLAFVESLQAGWIRLADDVTRTLDAQEA